MKRFVLGVTAVLLTLLVSPGAGLAEDSTAEVRTWAGQSLRLADPSFQVAYTVLLEKDQAGVAPAGEAVAPGGGPLELRGSVKALSSYLDRGLQSRWGRRGADTLMIRKDGVETRVPLESIQTLHFTRQAVTSNVLPPYHAPAHFRHAASVVLKNGDRLEADYVNLGTAVLTGATPQGRVEIPWGEIEVVRFAR